MAADDRLTKLAEVATEDALAQLARIIHGA